MKKRIVLIIVIAIVLLSTTMIFAFSDILKNHKKIDGRYQVFDSTLQEIPQINEDQVDNNTGLPTVDNASIYETDKDTKTKSKSVELTTNKEGKKFKIEYYEKDGKEKPINNTLYGYTLSELQDDFYLLDDGFNIYGLNMNKKEIEMFVNDSDPDVTFNSDEYKKLTYPIWATNPIISPNHKYIMFFTTRNADNSNGKTIIKDLSTNQEQMLMDGQCFFIGNGDNNEIYVKNNDCLYEINYDNNSATIIDNQYMFSPIVKYPYLAYFDQNNLLILKNLKTSDQNTIKPFDPQIGVPVGTDLNRADNIDFILFLYQPDRNSLATTISIIDPKKMTHRDIVLDEKTIVQTYGWLDKNTLLLSITRMGKATEESYMIDINKLDELNY